MRDGAVVQPGDINTDVKFLQLMMGVELKGKTLLDVGCNCGEMCRLAGERAAKPAGIDINRDYIHQARGLHPNLSFSVRSAEKATGKYDVVLASAVFHYVGDHRAFFSRMARVVRDVLVMDVWLIPSEGTKLTFSHRGSFIPNEAAFRAMADPWFGDIENKGAALSPDRSERWIFHLRKPRPEPPQAILIYGKSGAGKTTYAKELLDFEVLQLDAVFIEWFRATRMNGLLSVSDFVDAVNERNDPDEMEKYHDFHRGYLQRWLKARVGFDVVIEGYDMCWKPYRQMVADSLHEMGWPDVSIVAL